MGRNNADFAQGLFHGSSHEFNEGDTVLPGKDGFAWASTNREVAQGYGEHLYEVEPSEDIQRVKAAAREFGIHASQTGYRIKRKVIE